MDQVLTAKEKLFTRLIESNRLPHSFIFFGPPSSNKEDFANSLAFFLEYGDFKIDNKKSLFDAKIITSTKEKKTIGIDEIREIRRFLSENPLKSKHRTIIISPAEDLSWQAQPALLKIVEEPPSSSLIIFIAHDTQTLIPPLLSRLSKIFFSSDIVKTISGKKDGLAEEVEKTIIKLYLENPIKNSRKITILLEKEEAAKKFNLNEKIQKKAIEIIF